MHIAHFTNTYYPVISGVVRSISTFRKALAQQGHNVFVFAQDANGFEDDEPFIFRYPAINLPLPGEIPAVIPISSFIDQLLPSLKLDVVHAHHPVLVGQAAATIAENFNIPFVFTFHTQYREYSHYFPLPQEIVQEFLRGAIDNFLIDFMRRCQHIVVPTQSMRELLASEYSLQDRVTVIPTGIDMAPYQGADGRSLRAENGWNNSRVLISVGRLAPEKNWFTLLNAAAKVMERHSDVRLVLIGDGPDRENLEDHAEELEIADRVEFLGKVPFEQIPSYLKAADLFTFASVAETQGLVSLEALAAGLPVIAVDGIGTRDIVEHGKVGLLAENDSQALAEAIDQALTNPLMLQRFKDRAVEHAAMFNINRQARKLVEVYQQAAEDKKANYFVKVGKFNTVT